MIRKLIGTDNDGATTILRLVLGVIFFAHGAQKMLGWFGGYGFTGTMGFFFTGKVWDRPGKMSTPIIFRQPIGDAVLIRDHRERSDSQLSALRPKGSLGLTLILKLAY